jgi:hypothetical protein
MVKIDNKQRLIASLDSSNYQRDKFGAYTLKISDTRTARIKLKKISFSYELKITGGVWTKVKASYYKDLLINGDGNIQGINIAGFTPGYSFTLIIGVR